MIDETSLAISIARMQEQMKSLTDDSAEAKGSRKEQYRKIEEISNNVSAIQHRLQSVETQLASSAPTIAEFVVMKHRIAGAGVFGRWIWAFVGFLVGLTAWVIGTIPALQNWFMGK